MICRICLQNSENCFGFFDEEGTKLKAVDIVSKYFWFKPSVDDNISSNLCFVCWNIILQFHELYIQAENANSTWGVKLNNIKKDPCFDDFQSSAIINNIKDDLDVLDDDDDLDDNDNNSVGFPDDDDLKDSSDWENIKSLIETENVDLKEEINIPNEILKQEDENEVENDSSLRRGKRKRRSKTKPVIENNEEEIENKDLCNKTKKRRGRPKKGSKKPKTSDSENDSADEQNIQKKTPKQIADFMERVREGDKIIASFTKIYCQECKIELPSFTNLKTHSSYVHKQKGFVTCCDKKFYKRSKFVDHIEKHTQPDKYKCDLCDKVSMTRWTLKVHMKNVHKQREDKPYSCKVCAKAFRLKSVMIRHELVHIPEDERKYKCTQCDRTYPSQGTLNHHIRTYHDRRYSGMCDICGKTYNNKQDVQRHRLEVHEGAEKTKYKCRTCGEEFATKYLCNRHKFEKHAHPDQHVEHKCEFCGKTLANSEALKSHIQYAHKAKLKFECNLCGRSFKRELVLKEHMAAHTGQPLYVCPHCPKTFTHNSNMHHHRKRVHPVEFEEARRLRDEKKESWFKMTALTNSINVVESNPIKII